MVRIEKLSSSYFQHIYRIMNVYFISGLGADCRLFEKIKLPEIFIPKNLEWMDPLDDESINSYAKRLAKDIDESVPFCIVGLSFGGIIAAEIAKMLKPVRTIIISSVTTDKEIPWYYKLGGKIKLNKIIKAKYIYRHGYLINWFFNLKAQEDIVFLNKILQASNNKFSDWAIDHLMKWENAIRPENIFYIHGRGDRVLPVRFTHPDLIVPGGGHLMVYIRSVTISEILTAELKRNIFEKKPQINLT